MNQEKVKFKSAGHELAGIISLPAELKTKTPAVILFHGLTNSKDDCPLINETAEALVQNGFIAFRFDFHGSGESPGEMKDKEWHILQQNAEDAIKFIAKDSRVDPERLGLWARSVGGTSVCLLPPDSRVKARVVASPAVTLERAMRDRFKGIKKKELELERKGKKLPGTGKYKGSFEFKPAWYKSLEGLDKRVLENLKELDTILILATAIDQKVSIDNACIAINNVKEPKKLWIFNADHDYGGVEEKATQMTIDWFNKYLK